MANARTQFDIPAGEWTKIINGTTSARVFKKKTDVEYMSLHYTDVADDPNGVVDVDPEAETVEAMVFVNGDWDFSNGSNGYIWVAPNGDVDGILTVT